MLLMPVMCFNSNMVRLREGHSYKRLLSLDLFQFQHGTIKSDITRVFKMLIQKFQFQHGTIKRLILMLMLRFWNYVSIPTWYD